MPGVKPYEALDIAADKRVDRDSIDPALLEAFDAVNREYLKDPARFLSRIRSTLRPSGKRTQESAIVIAEPGDSKKYCVAGQPPFPASLLSHDGNPNSYNIAVKAFFLDRINRQRKLMAPDGNYMSTVVGAAPDRDHKILFSLSERRAILNGDFAPHARRLIKVMKQFSFEGGYFFGVSRAATVGAAALRIANSENIDPLGGVLVSPVNFKNERFYMPAVHFVRDFKPGTKPENLSGHWWDDGPQIMLDLQARYGDGSYIGNWFTTNVIGSGIGYSHDRFLSDIEAAGADGSPVAIGCGERNAMTEGLIEALGGRPNIVKLANDGLVKVLVAAGEASGHGFTENHLAWNAIMSEGFRFLQSPREVTTEDELRNPPDTS